MNAIFRTRTHPFLKCSVSINLLPRLTKFLKKALEQYSNWWLVLQVMRYEHWLQQQDNAINQQLKYYEAEIAKIRKQRKVLVKFSQPRIITFLFLHSVFYSCLSFHTHTCSSHLHVNCLCSLYDGIVTLNLKSQSLKR